MFPHSSSSPGMIRPQHHTPLGNLEVRRCSLCPEDKYFPNSSMGNRAEGFFWAAAAAKSLQSCLTLCDPIDGSPPGSPIPGILQARTLEWVVISFSNAWKWKVKVKSLSRIWLLATPWTAAYQALPSMGFSRQEYWGGLPFPSPFFWAHSPKWYHFSKLLRTMHCNDVCYVLDEKSVEEGEKPREDC